MASFKEYPSYDGVGLAELVRKREVTATEVAEAAIERIEAVNPRLNAVVHKLYDQGRAAAKGALPAGPLSGVPYVLKDLISSVAGVPTTSSSKFLESYVPDHDTELVKRQRAAGLVLLGKTNTPEFGLLPTTEPEFRGATHNPWKLDRTPGGSSGGSGAAVAARLVPIGHGGDGGGSIRIPASCNGVFGLKITRGRNPMGPDIGEAWHGLVVEHGLTGGALRLPRARAAVPGRSEPRPGQAPHSFHGKVHSWKGG